MTIWRKLLQFVKVMLANRSLMIVAERGSGRMTYAKKPFAEQGLRFTLQRAGNYWEFEQGKKRKTKVGAREQTLCLGNREHQNRKNGFREQGNTREILLGKGNIDPLRGPLSVDTGPPSFQPHRC